MSTVISLKDVSVYYRRVKKHNKYDHQVLKNISLEVKQGECLGVLGRNGAGKSTLLRVLAGIIRPDKGSYHCKGSVSLLALQAGFIPSLSGKENIILGGMTLGMTRKEINEKVDSIIDYSELSESIDYPLNSYSTGMKARLGFSVAHHFDPDVILIDEVLGVGDATFRAKSTTAMKERINSQRTVVLVSHNSQTIQQNCNRAILIENGSIVSEGDVSNVLSDINNN